VESDQENRSVWVAKEERRWKVSSILATATKTAIMLDEVTLENILLNRQVAVLAKEFSKHGRCVECQARYLCLHSSGGTTCGEAIKQWSMEQAKGGAG